MNKRFIVSALIGIIIGFGSMYFNNDVIIRSIYTIANMMLTTLLLLAPIVILISLSLGVCGIKDDWLFYLKFLLIIVISLSLFGIGFYFIIKFIYPNILDVNMNFEMAQVKTYPLIEPFNSIYKSIKSINSLLSKNLVYITIISLIIGLSFGFNKKLKPIKNTFIKIETLIFKFIKNVMFPIMPIWTISVFANMTYGSSLSGFIYNDAVMSIIILITQLLFLLIMYKIASIISKIPLNLIIKSAKQLYLDTISMMGLGGNLILPYGVTAQTKLGVKEAYAKTITASSFNLPGSLIANIGFSFGIITIFNLNISDGQFVYYIIMLVIATIVAPTMPLSVYAVTSSLLTPLLGFNQEQLSIMSTLYYNQGTTNACANNCGDIYLGLMLNKKDKKEG